MMGHGRRRFNWCNAALLSQRQRPPKHRPSEAYMPSRFQSLLSSHPSLRSCGLNSAAAAAAAAQIWHDMDGIRGKGRGSHGRGRTERRDGRMEERWNVGGPSSEEHVSVRSLSKIPSPLRLPTCLPASLPVVAPWEDGFYSRPSGNEFDHRCFETESLLLGRAQNSHNSAKGFTFTRGRPN